jgi:hypothetical protein
MTGSRDPALRCVAAMAPWNLGWAGARFAGHPDEAKDARDYFVSTSEPGAPMHLDVDAVMRAMVANVTDWNYASHAAALKDRPLLLVAATRDTPDEGVAQVTDLAQAIRAAGGERVDTRTYDDDHPFSSHRLELADALVAWLQDERCGDLAATP